MLAALGLPGGVELFIVVFVLLKIGLFLLIGFVLMRRFPALILGLRKGKAELKDSFNDGYNGGMRH